MKSFLVNLLIGALGVGAAAYVYMDYADKLDKSEYGREVAEARVGLVMQSHYTQHVGDDRRHFDRAQMMSAFNSKMKRIAAKHPKYGDEDYYIKTAESKAKEGKRNKSKVADLKKRVMWLKSVYDGTVKRGEYKPLLSAEQHGVRVEILNLRPVQVKGKKALRMNIFIWGPPKDQLTFTNHSVAFVREIKETDKRGREKVTPAIYRVEWSGAPAIHHPAGKNQSPSKYIPGWPPDLHVGYWEGLPLFPFDATKFNLKLGFTVRTNGGTSFPIEMEWKGVEVDDQWKATDDAGFEAVEAPASPEDLKEMGIKL